ncbi:hypothetical protein BK133_20940 [Paenibacillus sp. FSL H8-0548]|uniref:S-layer homology domain-containing protein n=1 Tax=Paenibacillus sp. FSL H8-0548 TaxID=1920422 RepID=UPI00096E4738|nr:S-layer homology domain-containing protein [Paenibacillus sp. FSL H8-0548]OMF25791.1 hypothetical protein BK133_20940 [Paenibacillus sp. FSL H8-0548]
MKKNLSRMLIVLLMGTFLFPTIGNAENTTELTAQQKYDALAAKGIFAGINGEAALDQNMNRAQFARVAALILGLEGIGETDTKVVTEKPFSDVELGLWYTEEIAAAKEAGIFVGNADGTFNPKGEIKVQEMAVVVGRMLELEKVEDAEVEGAAPWAAGYIQAIKDARVDFPTNYTDAATRADLVSVSFEAEPWVAAVLKENEKLVEALKKQEEERKKEEEQKNQESTPTPTPTPTPSKTPLELINAASVSSSWANVNVTTFANAGITDVTNDNVSAVKVALESGGSSKRTVLEIQAIVNAVIDDITKQAALYLINDESEKGILTNSSETQVTVTTFADAGITGVTADNVSAVKVVLESGGSSKRTVSEIQAIVNAVIDDITKQAALYLINDESEKGILTYSSETQVTVTTFADAGVQYVTSDNLFAVKYYLEISGKSYPRSTTDIQEIVDKTIEELTVQSIYEYLTPFLGFGFTKPNAELFASAGITGLTDLDEDEFDNFLSEFESTYINFPSSNGGVPMQTKQQIQDVVDFYLDYLAYNND